MICRMFLISIFSLCCIQIVHCFVLKQHNNRILKDINLSRHETRISCMKNHVFPTNIAPSPKYQVSEENFICDQHSSDRKLEGDLGYESNISFMKSNVDTWKKFASLSVVLTCAFLNCGNSQPWSMTSNAHAAEIVSTDKTLSLNFNLFLTELEAGKFNRVVFQGINPSSLIAYTVSGESYLVQEGFPSYDDPRSPSGPTQAIAKVQHTPGVVCQQDISDAIAKSSRGKRGIELRPMLSHNSYPKEYEHK